MESKTGNQSRRLFLGLSTPQAIAQGVMSFEQPLDGAHWLESHNLHVTIRFLGKCDQNKYELIVDKLAQLQIRNFVVESHSVGFFQPNTLWVGIKRTDGIMHCRDMITNCLEGIGFSDDNREYCPHITIARLGKKYDPKQLDNFLDKYTNIEFPAFKATQFHLYESSVEESGLQYKILNSFNLIAE